jgi:hypothetical protein
MKEPENLISKDKMVDILCDIALINAIDNSHPQVLTDHEIKVMDFIYKKYGVDSLQFVESDLYYASVPMLYEGIYRAVEARLESERDSITVLIRENNDSKGDSLDLSDDYD